MQANRIGILTRSGGEVSAELRASTPARVGPLTFLALWRPPDGPRVLVLMPSGRPAPVVKKAGRPQAGAFLLEAGESFSLELPGGGGESWTFTADPVIALPAGPGASCGFCRAALEPGAPAFVLAARGQGPAGHLLCRGCAAAWREHSGSGGTPLGEERAS